MSVTIPQDLVHGLDTELRTQLMDRLMQTGAIGALQTKLHDECQKSQWQDSVSSKMLEILRQGGCKDTSEFLERMAHEVWDSSLGYDSLLQDPHDSSNTVRIPKDAVQGGLEVLTNALMQDDLIDIDNNPRPQWEDWR